MTGAGATVRADSEPGRSLAAAVSLIAFVAAFAADGGKLAPAWSAASAALLALAAAQWWRRGDAASLARHPLLPWTAAFLLIGLGSLIAAPCGWRAAWTASKFWTAAAFGLTAWLAWTPRHRAFFRAFVIGAASLQLVLTAAAALGGHPARLLLSGNPQYMGLWTAVAAILCLGLCVERRGPARAAAGALSAALAVGVFLLSTRAGLLALAAGSLHFLGRLYGRRALLGGAFAVCAAFAVLPAALQHRSLKSADPLAWKRLHIWQAGLAGVAEKPLLGWGPGRFATLYRAHRRPQDERPARFEFTTAWAHNDYLQAAAEWGVPATAFLLWGLGTFLFGFRPKAPDAAAAQSAFAAMAVFSFVNFPMALPVNGLLAAGLAGGGPSAPLGKGPPKLSLPVILLCGFAVLAAAGVTGSARLPWNDAALLAEAERLLHGERPDADGAERLLRRLTERCDADAEAWHALGHLEFDHRSPRPGEAARHYVRATALNPTHAPWRLDLAAALERDGNLEGAFRSAQQALYLEPRYADASLRLGRLMRLLGRPAAGERWLRRLLAERPEPGPLSEHARIILARNEAGIRIELALCQLALARPQAARATLEQGLAREPGNPVLLRSLEGLRARLN